MLLTTHAPPTDPDPEVQPRIGDPARVEVPGRDGVDVVVRSCRDGWVESCCERPLDGGRFTGGSGVLEYVTADGVWRQRGRLGPAQRLEDGSGEFALRLECDGEPVLLGRREYLRSEMSLEVRLTVPGGERVSGTTVNVGGGGLLITGIAGREIGEELAFALLLPEGQPVTGSCRVVRTEADSRIAVQFMEIEPDARCRLIGLIYTNERERRKQRDRRAR